MEEIIKRITSVEVIEVVAVSIVEGNGTPEHPVGLATKYYTKEGRYIGKLTPQKNCVEELVRI